MYVIDYIHYISVIMGALSGKVIILIIPCVCVLVIPSIIFIPIFVIYSGRNPTTIVPTTTTTEMIIEEGTYILYIILTFTHRVVC